MDYLDRAHKSLKHSIASTKAINAQAHALDSIAASLLHIAENTPSTPATVSEEKIELIVRRLMDGSKSTKVGKK